MPSNPLNQKFYNFRGLWDRDDSGLIPSDPSTGVFASAILNATCEDGTINFNKGYETENDGNSITTHYNGNDSAYILRQYRLKRRDGTIIIVSHLSNGKLEWLNTYLNRYETLLTSLNPGSKLGMQDFNKISQDRTYFGDGVGYLSYWNKAIGYYASDNGVDQVTITLPNASHTTLAQGGFSASGTITYKNGSTATYSGLSGMTLTGVSALPVSPVVGDGIAEAPDTSTLTTAPKGRIMWVFQGRLGVVDEASPTVLYLSKVADGTDFATTGVSGFLSINVIDGDGRINAVVPFKKQMVVYKDGGVIPIEIDLLDSTTLRVNINPLILYPNIGPTSINQVAPGVDEVYWLAPSDKDIKQLSRVQLATTIDLSSQPIGTDVRNTLGTFNFDESDIIIDNQFAYITAIDNEGANSVIEYDAFRKSYYFHKLPASTLWRDANNRIHFTDPNIVKSYRLFSGYDADGASMSYLWRSGRLNFGSDFYKKQTNMFAVFGRMTNSSAFTVQLDYNSGALTSFSKEINGDGSSKTNGQYMLRVDPQAQYGTFPYGLTPYGGKSDPEINDSYFLAFIPLPANFNPYDVFVSFYSQGEANYIKIISFALNPTLLQEVSKYRKI